MKNRIVFDLDGTLVTQDGKHLKKDVRPLLNKLKRNNDLILWTHSPKKRADHILHKHRLNGYFKDKIYREDYAMNDYRGTNTPKDIAIMRSNILIDDNKVQQRYMVPGKRQFTIEELKKKIKKED